MAIALHVDESFWAGLVQVVEHLADDLMKQPPVRRAAEAPFRRIVRVVWRMRRGWNREMFALPPSLQQSWRLRRAVGLRTGTAPVRPG